MSIIDATVCGFLKIGVYSALTDESLLPTLVKETAEKRNEYVSRIIKQQIDFIQSQFSVEIKYKTFVDCYKKIVPHIQSIGKRNVTIKNEILNTFSLENWGKLSADERQLHRLIECEYKGFLQDTKWKATMSLFVQGIPKAARQLISKAEQFGLIVHNAKVKQARLTAKKEIKNLDIQFQNNFNIKFSEVALTKQSPSGDKKKIKEALKLAIKDIESQRTFGSNISLATRNKNRLSECFESKVNAIQRTETNYMEVSSGKKRSYDHTGSLENFVWQSESCLREVNNYPDGT